MDFIITFTLYMFALSGFFFLLKDEIFHREASLDIPGELLLSRLDNFYLPYDFLDRSRVDSVALDNFILTYHPMQPQTQNKAYKYIFKDFENPGYSRIDYCVYLQNSNNDVLKFFAAGKQNDYPIYLTDTIKCDGSGSVNNAQPYCGSSTFDAIVLTKPVLYENSIVNLKILICAQ